jgi:hypothetical protein
MKEYKSSSLKKSIIYQLGSVENDACGNFGSFTSESVRGSKILNKFLELDFKYVVILVVLHLNQLEEVKY